MHPVCRLTIDGTPVSDFFWSRLISVTLTDQEGIESDTIEIDLEAGPPFPALPREKAVIKCWLGYAPAPIYMGAFEVDEPTLHFLPYRIRVSGKALDLRAALKEHRLRHWDGTTFGAIVDEIAGEGGLAAQVAGTIASFEGRDGYFAQENESGLHFVERTARRLGGLVAVKDGKLIVAMKGEGETAIGNAMGVIVVSPPHVIEGTGSVTFSAREKHKEVRASYHDTDTAETRSETAPALPDGRTVYTLRHRHANKDEAMRAAAAKARELQRNAGSTSVTIVGNPHARGGGPMVYAGIHPEVDGLEWVIKTATHTFAKDSFQTALQAQTSTKGDGGRGHHTGRRVTAPWT